jgi:hypothetical protein
MKLKDIIIYKPVSILKNQVFWIVAPCGWVISSGRFEGKKKVPLPSSGI